MSDLNKEILNNSNIINEAIADAEAIKNAAIERARQELLTLLSPSIESAVAKNLFESNDVAEGTNMFEAKNDSDEESHDEPEHESHDDEDSEHSEKHSDKSEDMDSDMPEDGEENPETNDMTGDGSDAGNFTGGEDNGEAMDSDDVDAISDKDLKGIDFDEDIKVEDDENGDEHGGDDDIEVYDDHGSHGDEDLDINLDDEHGHEHGHEDEDGQNIQIDTDEYSGEGEEHGDDDNDEIFADIDHDGHDEHVDEHPEHRDDDEEEEVDEYMYEGLNVSKKMKQLQEENLKLKKTLNSINKSNKEVSLLEVKKELAKKLFVEQLSKASREVKEKVLGKFDNAKTIQEANLTYSAIVKAIDKNKKQIAESKKVPVKSTATKTKSNPEMRKVKNTLKEGLEYIRQSNTQVLNDTPTIGSREDLAKTPELVNEMYDFWSKMGSAPKRD